MEREMKAKDYAEIYEKAVEKNKAIIQICNEFIRETKSLVKTRKVQTASGLNGVLREQRQKWIAFSRQTKGVLKEDGFELLMKQQVPEIGRYF
jgi:hypothetical protein